jgi:hypothetical protein
MATTTLRTVADRVSALNRMIVALGRDPSEWEPDDLVRLNYLRGTVDDAIGRAVMALRDQGVTDGQIARVLNVSQQAVSKRWPGGGRYVGAAGRYRATVTVSDDAT